MQQRRGEKLPTHDDVIILYHTVTFPVDFDLRWPRPRVFNRFLATGKRRFRKLRVTSTTSEQSNWPSVLNNANKKSSSHCPLNIYRIPLDGGKLVSIVAV